MNQKKRRRKHNLPKGVTPKGGGFVAEIKFNGKRVRLGTFPTPESAHTAYCAKATQLFGEFARFN